MLHIMTSCVWALAACTLSPQDVAMLKPTPAARTAVLIASEAEPHVEVAATSSPVVQDAESRAHAAQGPIPKPVSASENLVTPMSTRSTDSPAEALGRRTLSTAFVMVGPDGYMTVELHNGNLLVLHNVLMRTKDYCGWQRSGTQVDKRYCGRYADIAAARPGGAPSIKEPR